MDFTIDINTFLIIIGFVGGYYTLKSDVANVKTDVKQIKISINGVKGDNGINGRLIKLEQNFKNWMESHHG